jgi:REP element-mobilizing transposase RayT
MCLLLQEGIQRFNYLIHSFCFLDNHIHLAIQVNETSISKVMQNLAFRYTRYINKKLNRIGHLFQGRFKSVVVDDKMYLKELVRYIHLNPVRAGLVNSPEKYCWSSHGSYLMLNEYAWLTFDYVLRKFGVNRREALIDYENYILKGIGVDTTLDFKRGCSDGILGDEEFVEDFLGAVNKSQRREMQLPDLVEKICEKFGHGSKTAKNG